jgi:hypothetical protein
VNGYLAATNILTIGGGGSLNQLIVANGGVVSNTTGFIQGNNSLYNVNAVSNSVLVDGGTWANANTFLVGRGGKYASLIVTNGGRVFAGSGDSYVYGQTSVAIVTGTGSLLSVAGNLSVQSYDRLEILNGATGTMGGYLSVGGTPDTNALLRVSGPGTRLTIGTILYVGNHYQSMDRTNWAEVLNGALVQANDYRIGRTAPASGQYVTNGGAIYQFTTATPSIALNSSDSKMYLSDGTIAFTSTTNVNVKGNWAGTDLTKLSWAGTNTFRLDAATNATTPDQSYIFATGLGPTNYTRLEMFNGSVFRGGSVTVSNGGSLAIGGSIGTLASNLVMQTGAAFEVALTSPSSWGRLVVQGTNVAVAGSTLRLNLGFKPEPNTPFLILDNQGPNPIGGQFANGSSVTASYGGTEYTLRINYAGGNGNDVVLMNPILQPGIVVLIR